MKIAGHWMGFTNEIITFINNIFYAYSRNIKVIVLDNFLIDINTKINIPVEEVINIDNFNNFLKESNYDIFLFSKKNFNVKIKSIQYGFRNIRIDLTNTFLNQYYNNNKLIIPNNIDLNNIYGDPMIRVVKFLYVKYSINEHIFEDCYQEYGGFLKENINYNFNSNDVEYKLLNINKYTWGIYNYNKNIFDIFLKNISFNEKYNNIAYEFYINNFKNTDNINAFHLRLEDDAIIHWGNINNINIVEYKKIIENKYIDIIKRNIDKNDKNIILSYSTNNNVINYLKDNGYHFVFVEKNINIGRELNALVDLLISKFCNNKFIGNFNTSIGNTNGSTFSYYITQVLNKNVDKILITMEKIMEPETYHK